MDAVVFRDRYAVICGISPFECRDGAAEGLDERDVA